MSIESDYLSLEDKIKTWLANRADIVASIVVGSRARDKGHTDRYSDLDLILFTERSGFYSGTEEWLDIFGEIWLKFLGQTGAGDPEWIVVYAGSLKVDFVIVQAATGLNLPELLSWSPYKNVFARGMRILQNATVSAGDGMLPVTTLPPASTLPAITESVIDRLLLSLIRATKLARRHDLWRWHLLVNAELRPGLLQLIEWEAQTDASSTQNTWYDGRSLADWVDPEILERVKLTFPGYDAVEIARATSATLNLLEWLSAKLSQSLGLNFPTNGQRQAINWLRGEQASIN